MRQRPFNRGGAIPVGGGAWQEVADQCPCEVWSISVHVVEPPGDDAEGFVVTHARGGRFGQLIYKIDSNAFRLHIVAVRLGTPHDLVQGSECASNDAVMKCTVIGRQHALDRRQLFIPA